MLIKTMLLNVGRCGGGKRFGISEVNGEQSVEDKKERCSKCKAYRVKDTKFCICGHRWASDCMGAVEAMLNKMGISLEK